MQFEEQDEGLIDTPKSKRSLSVNTGLLIGLICAIVVGAAVLIFFEVSIVKNELNSMWWVGLVCAYPIFAFIALLGHDTFVWDFLLGCLTKSIHMPGVIFSLDIDGIVFMLAYKFIIAPIVSVLLWLVLVLAGIIIAFILSAFVFPFKIPKHFRETFLGE